MPTQIDHVVALVRDLAPAVADYEALGFTVVPGGEHVGGATHNALVSFADGTYIELIAFRDPDRPNSHAWWPYLAKGGGWVDFALLEPDLDGAAARLTAAGVGAQGPGDGGRLRPDGQAVAWRSVRTQVAPGAGRLPFLIDDVTPRGLRVPSGAAIMHQLPIARVAGATIVVTDLARASATYASLLGTEGTPFDGEPGVTGHRFALGAQWLTLLAPTDDASDLARTLRNRGEGLYEVAFGGAGGSSARLLDLGLAHGARMRIVAE
jgi:catechol 2,3-dioxygenase-like lactoylglutathione lyase family enzyme